MADVRDRLVLAEGCELGSKMPLPCRWTCNYCKIGDSAISR
jgi:hypothetical protein